MATNTKIIKLNNGLTGDSAITYAPVTLAEAVQYSYNGGVMSVQQAIGTVASSVVSSTDSISSVISTHTGDTSTKITYTSGSGLGLSGVHADTTTKVKVDAGTGIKIESITGGIKISNTQTSNQTQWLNVNGGTSGSDPEVRLDSNGSHGKFKVKGSTGTVTNGTSYGSVFTSYTSTDGIVIKATYTDTNTVFTGSADASSTTTASTPSVANGMIGVIQKVASTNGTSFTTTQYVGVPSRDYVDNAVSTALTSALKYKGTVASNTELSGKTKTQGDVWVVSTAGDYTVTSNGSTTATSQHLEPGDYLICNGTTWDAVNGENQVTNGSDVLEVPYTTTAGTAATIATVDGTDLTLTAKHASVSYTSSALTALTPAHGGNFTVIGNVEVTNGHVTKLHTQKVTLPADTHAGTHNISAKSTTTNVTTAYLNGTDCSGYVHFKGDGTEITTSYSSGVVITHASHSAQTLTASSTKTVGFTSNAAGHITAASQIDIATMGAATASAAGTKGFVPAPPANSMNKVLTGAATFKTISASLGNLTTGLNYEVYDAPVEFSLPLSGTPTTGTLASTAKPAVTVTLS